MAFSDLPKIANINAAIAAVKKANDVYTTAFGKIKPTETALKDAEKARNDAEKKLQEIYAAYDSGAYLKNNTGYTSALTALTAAEKKLNDLVKYKDSEQYLRDNTTYKNAVTSMQEAEKKLNEFRNYKDSGQYVKDDAGYKTALTNVSNAEKARDNAQRAADNANDNNRAALEKTLNAANATLDKNYQALDKARETAERAAETKLQSLDKVFSTAQTTVDKSREAAEKLAQTNIDNADKAKNTSQVALDKARDSADKTYQNNNIKVAQTAYDKSVATYDKTGETLQSLKDSSNDYFNQVQDRNNDVLNYVNEIKDNLGGISKASEVAQTKTLLNSIKTSVDGTKVDSLIKAVNPVVSSIDPSKLSSVPKLNEGFKNANVDYFSNVDRETGMPILDQGALDSLFSKYKDNTLDSGQYRDNYDKFGWNVKSDGSSVSRGAAIVGLDMGTIPIGMSGGFQGVVKSGTNTAATDADMKKAADQLGIDIKPYYSSQVVSGPIGSKTTQNVLDKGALYNEINDRLKDFYVVGNALDRTGIGANQAAPHAAVLFKADGSGNLIPVTKDGKVVASYYNAVGVTHAGWKGQLAELAPLISIASMAFMPGVSSALNQAIGNATIGTAAAVAPTAFTVGLPASAISLGSVIGATGVNALTGAVINGGMAAITGGDVGKAMLSGAAGAAASVSAGDIANKIMGGGQTGANNIAAIAKAANLSVPQTEKIIASGFASGLTSLATDPDNALKNMAVSIASNFTSEEAKNIVSGSIDPKSVNGLTTFVSNAVDVGTSALINGQDVGKVLENSAPSLIMGAAKAQSKYVPPINVSSGASGFPIKEELNNYYKDLLASEFDEDVTSQIKTLFPNISDADAKYMAQSFVGKVAADQFGVPVSQLQVDIAGGRDPSLPPVEVTANQDRSVFDKISGGFSTLFNLSEITDPNAPSDGKSALLNINGGQGSVGGKSDSWFELIGFTSNGNPVYSASGEKGGSGPLFTLFTVDGKPQLVDENKNVLTINFEAAKKLEDMAVNVKQESKANNADERIIDPKTFEIIKEPKVKVDPLDSFFESLYKSQGASSQYTAGEARDEITKDLPKFVEEAKAEDPLKGGLISQYAQDPNVMRHYIDEAYKSSYYSGMPLNKANISKTALGLLKGDLNKMFSSNLASNKNNASNNAPGDIPGNAPGDIPGNIPGNVPGNAPGDVPGDNVGTGEGFGGVDAAASAAAKAAAEKAASAKRQSYYNQMMGVVSLPTVSTPASTKQASPSEAFYYGKEFGSPTQAISDTGELVQKPYQSLSVTQPGKEVAPTGVTGENDVSALLSNILSQGDETSLNDLLEIIGGSQYG